MRQQSDPTFFNLLNDLKFGKISVESSQILQKKVESYNINHNTYLTTFLVSFRKTANQINDLFLDILPITESKIHIAIDREEGQVLDSMENSRTFKTGTNLPSKVVCVSGAKVMFLNNTMISLGISNSTCGVIVSLIEDGYPNIAFPTSDGIRVSIYVYIYKLNYI
jgi:hypothetical protein